MRLSTCYVELLALMVILSNLAKSFFIFLSIFIIQIPVIFQMDVKERNMNEFIYYDAASKLLHIYR